MNVSDLKVGQFAERNKNIIYRFKPKNISGGYPDWLNGIYHIDRNPEIPLWHSTNGWTAREEYCNLINNPEKKHVDNAIRMLKDDLKKGGIDNLSYVENLSILKNYLKPDIVEGED